VRIFRAQYFFALIQLCTIFFSNFLKLDINMDNECCIGIKAKASALQQHNSNCVRVNVFGCAIQPNPHFAAGAYDALLTDGGGDIWNL
jgi:hypothetical protein